MNELASAIRSFGVARLAAIVGAGFGVALALGLIVARVGAPAMGVLYADLPYADAEAVIAQLEQTGADHEIRDGAGRMTILAPREDIARLRLDLAANGVIVAGDVGYELFDDNSALGATSFQQNINRLRALEGELARTIARLDGVRAARVHLVLPERELFSRDRETASASIVVDAPAGLDQRSVRAIANLVASATPGLEPSRVTVLDGRGALLAAGAETDSADAMAAGVEDRKVAAEARIRRAVEDIVGRIVGGDNVRVEVAADMDFSRVTESAEIVDPDSQTVLSSVIVEETSNDVDPARADGVSVANALPGAPPIDAAARAATSSSQRTEETTNYEISKTVRNAVREEGLVVKRLSVAVAVNGRSVAGPDGAPVFAPRDEGELERIETLVKSAIGFNAARGDQVSVVDIPFAASDASATPAPAPLAAPTLERADIMRLAEIAALALIALALLLFVARPLFSGRRAVPDAIAAPPRSPAVAGQQAAALEHRQSEKGAGGLEQTIDLAQVHGQVKASSINKVAEIVKAHADESAGILRGWMREAS